MKKTILILTNIILSLANIGGVSTEYLKLNTYKFDNLMRFESLEGSLNAVEDTEQPQIKYTVVKEKKAEEPKPIKTEEPKEVIKNTDNDVLSVKTEGKTEEKTEESKKEVVKEEPKQEEPKQEKVDPLAGVVSGNRITFNNLNKAGGVESLSPDLQGYADQIMGVVINQDEMTHCFKFPDLSMSDFEKVKEAINKTYYSYYADRLGYYCFDEGEYYIQVNSSKERYNKNLELESYINNAVNSCVNSSMNEKEAITAINNYICNLINYSAGQDNALTTFKNNSGNCRAYAYIFKLMCNQIGIQCDYITGLGNSGDHAWNKVYINGVGYWVDCCWNDTSGNSYLLSADLWDNHSVSTINQYFYNN